ncbi:hypothetical protein RIF29_38611 [Crotalaria pallida]|uniref:Uncharacterized protein n=1 Tax=Crotalaria pallida TaxID=3830 RepID=A0AAN9DZK0_CROPI
MHGVKGWCPAAVAGESSQVEAPLIEDYRQRPGSVLGGAAGLVHRRYFTVLGACRCRRAFFRCLLRSFSLQAFKCCSSLQTSSALQGWY